MNFDYPPLDLAGLSGTAAAEALHLWVLGLIDQTEARYDDSDDDPTARFKSVLRLAAIAWFSREMLTVLQTEPTQEALLTHIEDRMAIIRPTLAD